MRRKTNFGTRQWAETNVNFVNGCAHDCKYCYSKEMAIRFKRKTPSDWKDMEVRQKDVDKKHPHYPGTVMFPSSHDIHPDHLDEAIKILENLLIPGNKVLITSKPHIACIERICDSFGKYKKNILFRFTVGSTDTQTLNFWEPNAPDFSERLECLRHVFNQGFRTSVSCEPMLDGNIDALVNQINPYVTETIWIGKMKGVKKRLMMNGITDQITLRRADALIQSQSNNNIWALYHRLNNNPKIRWKEVRKIKMPINNTNSVN